MISALPLQMRSLRDSEAMPAFVGWFKTLPIKNNLNQKHLISQFSLKKEKKKGMSMIIKLEQKKKLIIGVFSTANSDPVVCDPKLTML